MWLIVKFVADQVVNKCVNVNFVPKLYISSTINIRKKATQENHL